MNAGVVVMLLAVLVNCSHTVPLQTNVTADIAQVLPAANKIPAKVGIYISPDLRQYVYKQQKMGMVFHMNVGEYVTPVSKQMTEALFASAVYVNALPPYLGTYKPDVEAVVEPEILYCYGNAIGTVTGHIEAKIVLRVTAYDLGGKTLWQSQATGVSTSGQINLVGAFLGGMEEVGKTGYQAAFNAASRVIENFKAKPPQELYSLLDIKKVGALRNERNISDFEAFTTYYQKGRYQFEKKNFYQALYSFEKAEGLNPGDPSTQFYVAVCCFYTGQKDRAARKFNEVVTGYGKSQEAKDSAKWIDLLREPLKIAAPVFEFDRNNKPVLLPVNNSMSQTLGQSLMYSMVNVNDLKPPSDVVAQKVLRQFLDGSVKRGALIGLIVTVMDISGPAAAADGKGDVAREYALRVVAKAYSTRKKVQKADIWFTERTTTLLAKSKPEEDVLKQQMMQKGGEKLVLRLLENDIF